MASDVNKQIDVQHTLNESTGTIFPIQFVQVGDLSDVPAPLVRISTCGGMRVEVLHEVLSTNPPQGHYVIVTPQQRRRGSTTGRNLLSALVSLPGHYAAKSWLTERLCRYKSEDDEDDDWPGMVRVDNIVTLLRGLLCPPGIAGEKELRKALVSYVLNRFESGSGYQLVGEPLLWLDVDVIEASVKEACLLEKQGQDALPMWERAHALASRGGYLLDERYSDWAESKRREVEGYQRQAVHALHRLYLAHKGEAAEEQVLLLLRSYWQTHLTDEDVLRPLLEVLGKRGCFQEAEEYYQRLYQELELEGLTPNARTQHTMQNLKAKQSPHEYTIEAKTSINDELIHPFHLQDKTSALCSYDVPQNIIEATNELVEKNGQNMDPLRRTINAGLISLLGGTTHPLEWWERLANPRSSVMNTEAFIYFQQLLEIGWRLSNTGELHAAEQVVMSFLPRMFQLAPHQKEAASIAAEGLRLQGILAAHQQKMLDKLAICLQSVEFARQTNNPNILIAQLTELAVAFRYAHQPANSFRIYQEALSYCQQGQISPLVRSRIYAASAPTFATNGYIKEAHSFIEKAYNSFPTKLYSEPNAFSADNQLFMIDYYQGLLYLVLNQSEKAYQTFDQAIMRTYESQIPERWRLIILNYQGLAAILSKQLDQYSKCLEEGLSGSIALGSKKRLDEAVSIYQHYMPQKWKNEACIKQLTEHFLLEQESRREEELEIW